MEVRVIIENGEDKRILLIIDKDSSVEYLSMMIVEKIEKWNEFNNLKGLKAVNLRKKTENKGFVCISGSGDIKEYLNDGDCVHCEIRSDEVWIKVEFCLINSLMNLKLKLDLKVKLDFNLEKLRLILIKMAIGYFKSALLGEKINSAVPDSNSDHHSLEIINLEKSKNIHTIAKQNFIVTQFETKFAKTKVLIPQDTNKKSVSEIDSNISVESDFDFKPTPLPSTLRNILDFNSEVNLKITFSSVEELITKDIQNNLNVENELLKLRLNEFNSHVNQNYHVLFDINSKFHKEFLTIRKVTKSHLSVFRENIYNYSNIVKENSNRSFSSNESQSKKEIDKLTKPLIFIIKEAKKKKMKTDTQFYESKDKYIEKTDNVYCDNNPNDEQKDKIKRRATNYNLIKEDSANDSSRISIKNHHISEIKQNNSKTFTENKLKKSETSPFKNINKHGLTLSLSSDIKKYITQFKLSELIASNSTISLYSSSMELTKIPEIRNMEMLQMKGINSFITTSDSVKSVRNKKGINFKIVLTIVLIVLLLGVILSYILYYFDF